MAFLGATAFRVLVAVDTVAEIAAPRPGWKDVGLCKCDAQIESKDGLRALGPLPILGREASPRLGSRGFKLGGRGGNSLPGAEPALSWKWKWKRPIPSWDALSSPGNALKRCRKDGTGP